MKVLISNDICYETFCRQISCCNCVIQSAKFCEMCKKTLTKSVVNLQKFILSVYELNSVGIFIWTMISRLRKYVFFICLLCFILSFILFNLSPTTLHHVKKLIQMTKILVWIDIHRILFDITTNYQGSNKR